MRVTGEPDAVKAARPVRRGADGKVLRATGVTRRRPTLPNLVLLKQAEFDGQTSGAAYETYLMIDRILDPLIGAGKFLGEGLLIFGILTGLATIIWHLSLQARTLPALTRRALRPGLVQGEAESPRPDIPGVLLKLGIVGFSIIVLATPLAIIRSGFIGWALDRQMGW